MRRIRIEPSNNSNYLAFIDLGKSNDFGGEGYHLTREEASRLRNRLDNFLNPAPPKTAEEK